MHASYIKNTLRDWSNLKLKYILILRSCKLSCTLLRYCLDVQQLAQTLNLDSYSGTCIERVTDTGVILCGCTTQCNLWRKTWEGCLSALPRKWVLLLAVCHGLKIFPQAFNQRGSTEEMPENAHFCIQKAATYSHFIRSTPFSTKV
jgi:hypothetical protein